MDNILDQLLNLKDCNYELQDYSVVLSNLTILATHESKATERIYLYFGGVEYIEMPVRWKGDFTLASDDEYISIEKKSLFGTSLSNYPLENRRRRIEVFKVNRTGGNVYLMGTISDITVETIKT